MRVRTTGNASLLSLCQLFLNTLLSVVHLFVAVVFMGSLKKTGEQVCAPDSEFFELFAFFFDFII